MDSMDSEVGITGDTSQKSQLPNISDREREVLYLVAEGLKDREIAEKLSISPCTVRTHEVHLRQKLDVHSRIQLINQARKLGIL